ncbi:MAG TPA: ATP-binding protein, partial [Candidatus Polarisedimenticolia bacterium]|nr:ATP-binding protein [Candidatus Polarisedimenticolia bacterium]
MARSRAGVYGISIAAGGAAILLRFILDPWLGNQQPYSIVYAAVALAVWLGGYRPAGVAALVAFLPATWLFVEPRQVMGHVGPTAALGFFLYLATCGIVIAFGEAMRRASQRAEAAREEAQRHSRLLQESENRFRALADSAPVSIWMDGPTGDCILVNRPYLEYTGLRRDQVEGPGWVDVVHPDDSARYVGAFREALAHRSEFHQEVRLRGHDGTYRSFEVFARPRFEGDRFLGHVGICIDVTERKAAQATAAMSDERLASELEAMSRLHALSSRLMSATDLNVALEDVMENAMATCGADFGNIQVIQPTSGALEIAAQRGFRSEFLEHFRAVGAGDASACARALRQGAACLVEDVQLDPDFAPHRGIAAAAGFRAVQSTPLVTHDGMILGMLSTHFREPHRLSERDRRFLDLYARLAADLIERLRYERTLEQADRRKDEFLATLAHELRNPLAPIRNAVHVFKAKGPADPDLTWSRQVIERQLGQMARLLDDLLDVSRITRNTFDLRRASVPLAPVLANAVETSRPLIEEARHELIVEVPAEPIYLEADPVRLGQVFSNLLNNAARYTPEGGRIRLACERRGEEVVVSVRDTGIGIGPDMLPRVFDMFSQGEATRDRSRHGLGVGLSLAKGLVEMHGGAIEARSAGPQQGSEFVVRLPVLQEAVHPKGDGAAAEPATEPQGAKRRLLIVDDLKDNADSLAKILGLMGHEVHVAYDGEEGIQAAERHRPEVVLLDIGMPKLNGY